MSFCLSVPNSMFFLCHDSLFDWLGWVQVVDDYASKSFRLLAVAFGSLRDVAKLDLASMPLQALERHAGHMDLLGLVVMTNHLRTDSKETISHLQDRYDQASSSAWNASCV